MMQHPGRQRAHGHHAVYYQIAGPLGLGPLGRAVDLGQKCGAAGKGEIPTQPQQGHGEPEKSQPQAAEGDTNGDSL